MKDGRYENLLTCSGAAAAKSAAGFPG